MTVQLDWIPDLSTFSSRLAAIRHRMGWNIKEGATACGLKSQSWREWELSGRRPRDYQEICEQIAKHTGVDYVWLMTGQDRRPQGVQLTRGGKESEGGRNAILTPE
ncbi:helix-turn-helix transcriptional regulator [Mycobacteroides abscessus subsp. bolletii]|uniref:helix-turn-helix domain-containing protein n=1 Tax=Mycobacteroides abscessus TaxID=36809 RepID=UPI0019D118E7|nr:helix-turn-helix transcriptional regulator [Mycobacteroides abscessus]QSM88762.1 helix-turn-helix transcriptional regulator [Mycobacteroides abscessus subsp. bolletii]